MATIIIAEDHPFVREGIRSYLTSSTHHTVVAECSTGLAAIAAVNEHRPDVLLVDLRLPEMDGLEVIRRVKEEHPLVRMIVVSMHAGSAYVTRAVRNGAHGYLLKNSDINELSEAIEVVHQGGSWFSSSIAASVNANGEVSDPYDELTPREREVLQLVAEGKTASDIKEILFISARTVEKHRSNLMKKLGLHSQSAVIRYALQRGLIPLIGPTGGDS